MSLGGIAIAIGAMIDAAIIMVENAQKALEHFREEHGRDPASQERFDVIVAAAKSVGRPLFFSLLVITVSFIPVFSLEAQEGRLFRPLAFTKTFAMFFAAIAGVTLVPVLMTWLIRGKITPEVKNPINRFLIWLYQPFVSFVLRFPWVTILLSLLVLGLTYIPFSRLGKEFMPRSTKGLSSICPRPYLACRSRKRRRSSRSRTASCGSSPRLRVCLAKPGRRIRRPILLHCRCLKRLFS